jgi:hypothetical protein
MGSEFSLGSRQRISDSDSTKFYELRVVVEGGSINPVTSCTPSKTEIVRVWIPDLIIFLKFDWKAGRFEFLEEPGALNSIVFESNSRLRRIESGAFYKSSLESILIPRNIKIVGSKCFSNCESLSSLRFELNSRLT